MPDTTKHIHLYNLELYGNYLQVVLEVTENIILPLERLLFMAGIDFNIKTPPISRRLGYYSLTIKTKAQFNKITPFIEKYIPDSNDMLSLSHKEIYLDILQ